MNAHGFGGEGGKGRRNIASSVQESSYAVDVCAGVVGFSVTTVPGGKVKEGGKEGKKGKLGDPPEAVYMRLAQCCRGRARGIAREG